MLFIRDVFLFPCQVGRDLTLRAYTTMARLSIMDPIFNDLQRQGRITFYMTAGGEEATHVGSAMALQDTDEVID